MNLQKAGMLLIFGIVWTLFHKIIISLFPAMYSSGLIKTAFIILWSAASFTLILFAWFFVKEVPSLSMMMNFSMKCIIICTSVIIVTHMPIQLTGSLPFIKKAVFTFAGFLNSIALFIAAYELYRRITDDAPSLKPPLYITVWGYGCGVVLHFISIILFTVLHLTGFEPRLPHF